MTDIHSIADYIIESFSPKKISFILIDGEKYVYIDDDNVEIGDSFTKIKEFCDFIFCGKVNPDA